MDQKVKLRDLIEFLEFLVVNDFASDDEYGLYIDYRKIGRRVFKYEENRYIVRSLMKDYQEYRKGGELW